ncbi:MAG TPA: NADH-quinone oxidoreductase subunit NuoH [Dehalococcoidia bacterium]|nr:NADH-quinone oxidoreductase subunit NuoH [Dehalococcoidia bacterium]
MTLLGQWYDIRDLSELVAGLTGWLRDTFDAGDGVIYVVSALLGAVGILSFIGATAIVNIWIERRLVGRMQNRLGPNRVGPFGLLQPVADAIKLIQKEALMPRVADPIVFTLAPILVFVPAILAWAVLPWGERMTLASLDAGVLYFVALGTVAVLAVFMAGWSSNNKFSLLGAMRVVPMLLSYEIPIVLAFLGPVLLAGTMNLSGIARWQADYHVWIIFLQPLTFLIYFIAASAELNRTPADIAEAESEILAGYHTEYSGMKFGLFYAVELVNALLVSGLAASMWYGGWYLFEIDRVLPGWLVFIGKMYALYFLLIWTRGTLPRLRIDQLVALSWKFMTPLALANVVLVSAEVVIWAETGVSAGVILPLSAVVNVTLTGVLLVAWLRFMLGKVERLPRRPRLYREVVVPPIAAPEQAAARP